MGRKENKATFKKITAILLVAAVVFSGIGNINSFADTTAPTASALVNSSKGVNLRKKADTKSDSLIVLKNNAKLTILKEVYLSKKSTKAKDKWYQVQASGKTGYIRSDLVDNVKYSQVTGKTTTGLNYRVGPNSAMTKKGSLKKGASVTVVLKANLKGSSEYWYKIKIGKVYYYVSSKYVSLSSSSNTGNATSSDTSNNSSSNTSNNENVQLANPTITVSNASYPSIQGKGCSFPLSGTITSDQTIEKVVFGIVNSAGKWQIKVEKKVNAKTFNISSVDSLIKFGTLATGSYTYRGDIYVNGKCYTKIKKAFTVKVLTGGNLLANTALELAWPLGTASEKYSYPNGEPTPEYKAALDVAYPSRITWGAAPKAGASCDVFIGTVCRYSGYDKTMPRTLYKQWTALGDTSKWQKVDYSYKESELQNGDILIYKTTTSQHIAMYVRVNGTGYCVDAALKERYGRVTKSISKFFKSSDKVKLDVYRAVK